MVQLANEIRDMTERFNPNNWAQMSDDERYDFRHRSLVISLSMITENNKAIHDYDLQALVFAETLNELLERTRELRAMLR